MAVARVGPLFLPGAGPETVSVARQEGGGLGSARGRGEVEEAEETEEW